MLKRLLISLAILAGFTASVHAAGTIPGMSMTQQLDQFARPLSGGKLYLIQAGTTSTPQNCYQDTALTLAYPNPVTLDASGRVPQLFCADGNIKIRLTDKNGVTQLVQDNLLVIGPSSGGGGGGGGVDPTTVLATGDIKTAYGTGTLTGFVRANGRTIGSASSGATERANADTEGLFNYLWQADPNLVVSSGRGASSAADWAANKTIALPDARGRTLAGLDDMGASAAERTTGRTVTPNGTTLGASGGAEIVAIARSDLPNTSVAVSISDPGHTHLDTIKNLSLNTVNSGGAAAFSYVTGGSAGSTGLSVTGISAAFNLNGGVTQTSVSKMQPTILATIYLKL